MPIYSLLHGYVFCTASDNFLYQLHHLYSKQLHGLRPFHSISISYVYLNHVLLNKVNSLKYLFPLLP